VVAADYIDKAFVAKDGQMRLISICRELCQRNMGECGFFVVKPVCLDTPIAFGEKGVLFVSPEKCAEGSLGGWDMRRRHVGVGVIVGRGGCWRCQSRRLEG